MEVSTTEWELTRIYSKIESTLICRLEKNEDLKIYVLKLSESQ